MSSVYGALPPFYKGYWYSTFEYLALFIMLTAISISSRNNHLRCMVSWGQSPIEPSLTKSLYKININIKYTTQFDNYGNFPTQFFDDYTHNFQMSGSNTLIATPERCCCLRWHTSGWRYCSQNVSKFTANGSYNYKPTIKDVQLLNIDKPNNHSSAIEFKSEVTNQTNLSTVDLLTENALKSNGQMLWSPLLQNIAPSLYHHRRSTLNRSYFYSSGNIFAIRLVYGKIEKIENASNFHFYINGNFRFLNKCR